MIRVFIDFEFTHLGRDAQPISMACVTDCNERVFYAEFSDYHSALVSAFTDQFVLPHLKFGRKGVGQQPMPIAGQLGYKNTRLQVGEVLRWWLQSLWLDQNRGREHATEMIQVWGDVVCYDWLIFTDLLGGANTLPSWLSYIPMDIAVLFHAAGIDTDISRAEFMGVAHTEHDALQDAALTCVCYGKLMEMIGKKE